MCKMQGLNERGKGGTIPRSPNHCEGGEKSQKCHKYFLQYSKYASERFEHGGAKPYFLPQVPFNLVTPLVR